MCRRQLIAEIECLWLNHTDEGWNIAYDSVAEIGLDALTDETLRVVARRCRSEFGGEDMNGAVARGPLNLAL